MIGHDAPERNYDEFHNATGNGGRVWGWVLRPVHTAVATALVLPLHGDPRSFQSSTRQCPGLNWTRSSMTVGSNHGG